jgi:hypothetical protein
MTSSETKLHSGEGTLGIEVFGDLFVNLAFGDFKKAGQDAYRYITVCDFSALSEHKLSGFW